ncbi:hypothetical protein Bca101_066624 [Brassica carinata]
MNFVQICSDFRRTPLCPWRRITVKTIYGVAFPRRCLSATAHLATDGKLHASKICEVVDNVNGTAAWFVNSSFNRPNLFGLLGGYM